MRRAAGLVVLALLLAALILNPAWFDWLFAPLTRNGAPAMYTHTSLLRLTLSHLAIVALSVSVSVLIAVPAAIWVTRGAGREFLPLVRTLVGIGQTFPPVAVLALAVPMMGFGAAPTFLALTLYGLLPIFENSLAALSNLPAPVVEAARGMGMTEGQVLRQVELPLALPLIIAGVRLTTVISLSTAAIGSTVAAKSLGEGRSGDVTGIPVADRFAADDQVDVGPRDPGVGQRGSGRGHPVLHEVAPPLAPGVHAGAEDVERIRGGHEAILQACTVRTKPSSSV